jgi:futalosine hydrolase
VNPQHPVALLCSVAFECERLRAALRAPEPLVVGGKQGWSGTLDGAPVLVLAAGMGKTNAAHALTALLETRPVRGVVGFGIAGAYPGSGLQAGDVALATECVYGDDGVLAPGGWMSIEGIGIPLWTGCFNRFPVDAGWVARTRAALEAAGTPVRTGPFVTVSACTGTDALAAEMEARVPGALCEGMEGAALAHVAAMYGVPFIELRAVSNRVENRDPSRWRIPEAAAAAQRALPLAVAAL